MQYLESNGHAKLISLIYMYMNILLNYYLPSGKDNIILGKYWIINTQL